MGKKTKKPTGTRDAHKNAKWHNERECIVWICTNNLGSVHISYSCFLLLPNRHPSYIWQALFSIAQSIIQTRREGFFSSDSDKFQLTRVCLMTRRLYRLPSQFDFPLKALNLRNPCAELIISASFLGCWSTVRPFFFLCTNSTCDSVQGGNKLQFCGPHQAQCEPNNTSFYVFFLCIF